MSSIPSQHKIDAASICARVKASGGEVTSHVIAFASSTAAKIALLFMVCARRGKNKEETAAEATVDLLNVHEAAQRVPEGANGPKAASIRAIGKSALAVRNAVFFLLRINRPGNQSSAGAESDIQTEGDSDV